MSPRKTFVRKIPQKYPLLRCPQCGYQYRPTMHGWAFRTDKNTKCIGQDAVEDGRITTLHSYNHPFEVAADSLKTLP